MTPADTSDIADVIHVGGRTYPLPGYGRSTVGDAEIIASAPLVALLSAIVASHGTLYSWARHQEQPRALRGRAPVYVATLDDAQKTTLVVRHSWHGGLLAPITSDRFRRPTRAPIELLRSFMLRECRIPTPEVLGFALYRAGPLFARVDVATRYVENAYDFASVLTGLAGTITRSSAYHAVQALLVQLAAFGFTHPDLNVKNILLYQTNRELVAAILDIDVVKWDASSKPGDVMLANVARLARSMRKSRLQFEVVMPDSELNDFVARMLHAAPAVSSATGNAHSLFSNARRL